ncbi:MAG: hypothetical protein IKN55_11660 [Oscillospiraceae bacterium]|nr:hypothetical protein [Oscillospiraceae bacterium]
MAVILPLLAFGIGSVVYWGLGKLFPEWEYKPRLGIAAGVAFILFMIFVANLDSLL